MRRVVDLGVEVRLRNTGWLPWDSHARPPVMASYHWADASGQIAHVEGIRTPLPDAGAGC